MRSKSTEKNRKPHEQRKKKQHSTYKDQKLQEAGLYGRAGWSLTSSWDLPGTLERWWI